MEREREKISALDHTKKNLNDHHVMARTRSAFDIETSHQILSWGRASLSLCIRISLSLCILLLIYVSARECISQSICLCSFLVFLFVQQFVLIAQ